ncbi:aminoglycoside phosphotransferase family protein [Paenibacillus apiarius]|uniref:Phosphotransferase family protein n=1 Tax=Paenibacillus apiarius TaxID=46240 RepID=A0ABT4E0R3_9BACL|nr:phosphotransferase family protein [Paenibacillus apiarius]MCY9516830.1 phosphotransferase family protein [Paenibacillus apiarius]MCY9521923.1 phosphotransferase family protein [Paenibacillus apiarius]MCY9550469.1 phosphotransferase family protein [Paenibacillus apiarius]MCY9559882.1 phosphotransferase family protein [Paenibacillus apiarius]MCY9683434.1 phosphotransferase family protein [Paenibacillus apiarius]
MNKIFNEIPDACTWNIVEAVHKGWSKDKKYYIKSADGRELLLRMADISQYEKKQREFESVTKLEHFDILMSRPIDFGICNNGQSVYSLFTWVEGEDAMQVIPALSAKEQYRLGVKAGEFLRKMHQIPAENNQTPWAEYYNGKINKYITNYKACGIHLKGADKIINYVEQNRYLLENRPQSYQHGDYHVGNMIVTKSGELGIIDFNRCDYGDPWEEFNRITWCAGMSGIFASGRINGYFNNEVPDLFFRLMALYVASNQLSTVHWAIPFGQEEVDIMLERAGNVLDWYDEFQTYVPNWYLPNYTE